MEETRMQKEKDIKIIRNVLSSLTMGLLFFHLNLYLCAIDIGFDKISI